jgi:hypothetical protein
VEAMMANPLQGWKHGRKHKQLEPDANIIALQSAPVWDAETELWHTIMSKKIHHPTDAVPSVLHLLFGWDGTAYYSVGQENISDVDLIRKLEYPHRKDGIRRAYFYVYFEEFDSHLALLKGIR